MWKDVCSKEQLLFEHDAPEDFVRSLWQKKTGVSLNWVIYRATTLGYLISAIITICAKPTPGFVCKKHLIYFTNWASVAQIGAFAFSFGISVERYYKEKKDPELPPIEKMPVSYKVMWCMYAIGTPSVFGISVMFWVFEYYPDQYDTIVIYTILTHVCNPVVVLLDFFINAIPYRFLHIYCPVLLGTTYVIFSIIYQLSGGTGNKGEIPIYKILDWRNPKVAASTCTVSLGCVIIMHCVLGVLNVVRQFLKKIRDRGIGRENQMDAP